MVNAATVRMYGKKMAEAEFRRAERLDTKATKMRAAARHLNGVDREIALLDVREVEAKAQAVRSRARQLSKDATHPDDLKPQKIAGNRLHPVSGGVVRRAASTNRNSIMEVSR